MLKAIAIVGLVLVASAGITLAYAATKPDVFRVARSTTIKASPLTIFPLINEMRSFNIWNPYEKKDPNIIGTYSGPESGKGASYAFKSSKSGTGSLEIVDTSPPRKVAMKLTMVKPFVAENLVEFTLEPQGDTTLATWAMNGRTPLLGKVMHLFLDMDKMVGNDFEAGLANLKALAERRS